MQNVMAVTAAPSCPDGDLPHSGTMVLGQIAAVDGKMQPRRGMCQRHLGNPD